MKTRVSIPWLVAVVALAACDGSTRPDGQQPDSVEPPGWPLKVGDRVGEVTRSRLKREFGTIVLHHQFVKRPAEYTHPNQERYGFAEFEIMYEETGGLTEGEDNALYACEDPPAPSANGTISIDQEDGDSDEIEPWKTVDGAYKFSFAASVRCDPDKRYRMLYVYRGHVRP